MLKKNTPWLVLCGCILLSSACNGILLNCISVFYVPIREELGFSVSALSVYPTIRALFFGLFLPLMVTFYHKIDLNLYLSILLTAYCLVFAGHAMYQTLMQFYISAVLMGILGSALFFTPIPILINNWFVEKNGFALGLSMAAAGIMGSIFNPICSALILRFGWRTAMVLTASIAFAMGIPATALLIKQKPNGTTELPYSLSRNERKKPEEPVQASEAGSLLGNRRIFLLVLMGVLCIGSLNQFFSHFSLFATSQGYSLVETSFFLSLAMAGNAVFKILTGFLKDQLGTWKTIYFSIVLCVASYLLLLGNGIWTMRIASFLFGSAFSAAMSIPPLLIKEVYRQNYEKEYGIFMAFSYVSAAICCILLGVLHDLFSSYIPSISLMVLVSLTSLLTCRTLDRAARFHYAQ